MNIELTEYQSLILTKLKLKFKDHDLQIVRGDRIMINGKIITGGIVIRDSRNLKNYDIDVEFFSNEIKRHIEK